MAFIKEKARNGRASVNVPVRYVFRSEPLDWQIAKARVVGWSSLHSQGARDAEIAKLNLTGRPWTPASIAPLLLIPEALLINETVRIEVRQSESSSTDDGGSEIHVEKEFIPAGLLPLAATEANTPEIRSEWFPVIIDQSLPLSEERRVLDARLGQTRPPVPERDPWRMRKDFFAIKEGDNAQLVAFLRKWGSWGSDYSIARHNHLYRPQDFWEFRSQLRVKSVLPPKEWLRRASWLPQWERTDNSLYILPQTLIKAALEDTITLEKMKLVEHAVCGREGCGNIFAKSGKRPKTYCSEDCSAKVRQQRYWNARRNNA